MLTKFNLSKVGLNERVPWYLTMIWVFGERDKNWWLTEQWKKLNAATK
jgi:hypothetical protein